MATITVDTNAGEDAVWHGITAAGYAARRARLDVGDVLVEGGERRLCLERKTWADLAASICDGRLKEQKSRMVPEEGAPPTRYVYVVEGGAVHDWVGHHGGMAHAAMWACLVKTALRDDMPVLHTAGPDATAALCVYVAEQLARGQLEPGAARAVVPGAVRQRKRANLATPAAVLRAMLCVVPGVSVAKADAIVARWPTAGDLARASRAELAATECGGRRLGPKIAAALADVFGS